MEKFWRSCQSVLKRLGFGRFLKLKSNAQSVRSIHSLQNRTRQVLVAEIPPPARPARLMRNGRPIDPDFEPIEYLYFRIPPLQNEEPETDSIPPGKIQSVPVSVNRS